MTAADLVCRRGAKLGRRSLRALCRATWFGTSDPRARHDPDLPRQNPGPITSTRSLRVVWLEDFAAILLNPRFESALGRGAGSTFYPYLVPHN